MPDIRNLVTEPVPELTQELEHQGEKYLFKGSPSASNLAETVLLDEEKVKRLAVHWTAVSGYKVVPEIVKHIAVIHLTLQPANWNEKEKKWELLDPYDVTDIAKLVIRDSQFFVKALAAGYQCLGLGEEQQKHYSTLEQVMAGNSGEPEVTD